MTERLPAPPHVVAFRFSGEEDPDATEVLYAALGEATARHADVALYVELGWVYDLTTERFADDVQGSLERLAARADVRRVAFVAGTYEHRHAVRTETAAAADGPAVVVFPTAARGAAMEWAAEGGPPRVHVA